ncbi:GGDEF domain-containing protein [Pararhizobium antarcticum]|uniref:diguanylate cyclase n=1 Tax=Pararhizobium antarcticum TaxID=1798805 RepID=A0A657LWF5_9HYPH|nr:GGDEF domain-containing protein [Pararhizobium antarcticum]OJF91024.1 diguanylate cyclase [Rhizobium sp. 58]OJF99954.1 diguanylate cyclase [Pararhizobium antarcticum]
MANVFLFLGEALVYVTIMITLLHLRHRLGLGVFIAALGVMHFIETYLAAVFYVQLPFGVISPGSAVLFSGKLMMILLLYVKEDAATVRQPIYGLLVGNFLTVALGLILQQHVTVSIVPGRIADLAFIDEMGWLMVWGTLLLYLDSILIILLYERFGRRLRRFLTLRFFLCGAAVLTFDQAGFYIALHALNGAPADVFWGGWLAKMGAAAFYAVLLGAYLHLSNHTALAVSRRPIGDIFNDLTFRERYEDLLSRSGRDSLTGTLDRGRLEHDGMRLIRNAVAAGTPTSVMIIDADHFKAVNDRLGHPEGDRVLKATVAAMQARLTAADHLFRYGGEEFVIVSETMNAALALAHAEGIRASVEASVRTCDNAVVTISIGIASTPQDGATLKDLLSRADSMLYRAKDKGRNRVESSIS